MIYGISLKNGIQLMQKFKVSFCLNSFPFIYKTHWSKVSLACRAVSVSFAAESEAHGAYIHTSMVAGQLLVCYMCIINLSIALQALLITFRRFGDK